MGRYVSQPWNVLDVASAGLLTTSIILNLTCMGGATPNMLRGLAGMQVGVPSLADGHKSPVRTLSSVSSKAILQMFLKQVLVLCRASIYPSKAIIAMMQHACKQCRKIRTANHRV